jgi:Zn-dependent protease
MTELPPRDPRLEPATWTESAVVDPRSRRRKIWTGLGSGAVTAGGLLKFGAKLLPLLKSVAVLAKFKTAASMIVSVAVYALFWGWKFALGFVLLLFVHELGHVAVLRAQGVKASAPMFVPLLGAFVKIEGEQRSVTQEATSALAGPVVGVLGSIAVYGAAQSTGSMLLQALAYTGFLLNLFNLLPTLPLDGGRVAGALHPAVWFAGIVGAVVLLFFFPSPILIFILVLGGIEAFHRWRTRKQRTEYFAVPRNVRLALAAAYVATAAICLIGMDTAYVEHPHVSSSR